MSWIFLFGVSLTLGAQQPGRLSEGRYLTEAAGCRDCHSTHYSQSFAGGVELPSPFGRFYTPNISPDRATGIGGWDFEDFRRALQEGVSPSGELYYPSFPYRAYAKIQIEDLRLIYQYLMNQEPIIKENRPHQIDFPFNQRWLLNFWKVLFLRKGSSDSLKQVQYGPTPFVPLLDRTGSWNRGAYLVEAFFHCAECHTPRNRFGALQWQQWMGGGDQQFADQAAPNITPNQGRQPWGKEDWLRFLSSGFKPDGKTIGGEMAWVVQNTAGLTFEDREAIVEYLMSLEPVMEEQP